MDSEAFWPLLVAEGEDSKIQGSSWLSCGLRILQGAAEKDVKV